MRNIALLLRYDGTNYHGWQNQRNAVTVQEVVETAVRRLTGEAIPHGVAGCSRTDAGVHAAEFAANFETDCTIPADRFPAALRPLLPPDISVRGAKEMSADFHARFSCVKKEYIYRFYGGSSPDPFLLHRAYYHPYPLQLDAMNRAAAAIVGYRDFRVFMAAGSVIRDPRRTVLECRVDPDGDAAKLTVSADGFLYNMVRIIAGTLLAVSDGKLNADDIPQLIADGDRTRVGATLPPWGLYLNRIWYPEGEAADLIR